MILILFIEFISIMLYNFYVKTHELKYNLNN